MGDSFRGDRAGRAVGQQSDVLGQLLAERIVEADGVGQLGCEGFDDLLPGVDASGTAEFAKVFGEQRCQCEGVKSRGGLQELLFEREEMGG